MQPLVTNADNIHYTRYIFFLFYKPVNIEYAFFVLSFCWKNGVVKYFNKFFNSFLAKVTFLLLDVTQNFKNYIKILHCAVLKRKLKIRKKNEKRKSKVKVSFTYEGGVGGILKPAASAENALLSFPPLPPHNAAHWVLYEGELVPLWNNVGTFIELQPPSTDVE